MLSKLIKGLTGLGGAAALTTGGVFLKNHVERRMFISKANANIRKLWGDNNEFEGLYPDGNSVDDAWKLSWVSLVAGHETRTFPQENKFFKSFLEEREKVLWDAIVKTKNFHLKIEQEKKKEIDVGYGEYWIKYKEACLFWGSFREAKDAAITDVACMLPEKWETYKEKSLYKSYLEIKKEREMDVMEFYWTIWRRFEREKNDELPAKIADEKVTSIYKTWKEANKDDLFSNLTK